MVQQNKEEVRQQLLGKLEDLSKRDNRDELIRERCNDPMDQMQNRFEMDLTISVINNDWETRRAVETALKLLEVGDYGICQDCGAEINPNRLEAIPWTTLCVFCQDEYDCSGVAAHLSNYRRAA
ncbi:MAG: TraR/DksA family transcriptional regulator [Bryobacterales bacterium]|nr:TraR/DksA family transcriptional regulator [Bryobacterales bacterium]MDE0629741.1 TraR/DksA family transcriptional regulator [Bryobacterales bacterium]